jgi:uncharacterized protein (TIGR02300 family)
MPAQISVLNHREQIALAKLELGSKHQCQNCGAKFFDLNKDPIVCPKCGTVFQGAAARARPTAKPEEEEADVATPAGVDVVSLDEVEAAEEKAAEPVVDDIDVEEDAEEDGADDPFLEEEEEDDDDVSNLIDGDIAPDEET